MNKFPELKTLPTQEYVDRLTADFTKQLDELSQENYKRRFEIEQLKHRNAELEAQLVEVNNNRTGVAPCARFCEALAAKKMFDNLQRENAELMAEITSLQNQLHDVKLNHQEGVEPELIASQKL